MAWAGSLARLTPPCSFVASSFRAVLLLVRKEFANGRVKAMLRQNKIEPKVFFCSNAMQESLVRVTHTRQRKWGYIIASPHALPLASRRFHPRARRDFFLA